MTTETETQRQSQQVVTLVLRLWPVGPAGERRTVRFQATHVQTGETVYFRDVEGLTEHIERLRERLAAEPLRVPAGR